VLGNFYDIMTKRLRALFRGTNEWTGSNRYAHGALSLIPNGGSTLSGPFGILVTIATTNNTYTLPDQSGTVALVQGTATDPSYAAFATTDAGLMELRPIVAADISDGVTETFNVSVNGSEIELEFTNGVLTGYTPV
jgi:hypothetical protein